MSGNPSPRLQGRCESDRIRDDARHRQTLRMILEPVRACEAAPLVGMSTESWAARVRKLARAGLAERLHGARWHITQAGRDALASPALISYTGLRDDPPPAPRDDLWPLLLGARRPPRVTGRLEGKMQMRRA